VFLQLGYTLVSSLEEHYPCVIQAVFFYDCGTQSPKEPQFHLHQHLLLR
jgi:hypothetical protein